jgi:hypothetical protein
MRKRHLLQDSETRRDLFNERILPYLQELLNRTRWFVKNSWVFLIRSLIGKSTIRSMNLFEQRFYSQNGEDGILKIIFDRIGSKNRFCVEFGVRDGKECNTRYLIEKKGWSFLQMDCGDHDAQQIKKEKITAENINSLFEKYEVPVEFDLLSIDIDSYDYWVWKAINGYSPRVVVMEYNASIPPSRSLTVPYDSNMSWDGSDYFGASLLALARLGTSKGYTLICCESEGINAFFVRNDLLGKNFEIKSVEEIYRPPHYGEKVKGKYKGHPASNKPMMDV